MDLLELLKIGGPTAVIVFLFLYFGWRVVKECVMPAAKDFKQALDQNTKVTTEMHEFMKSLNGRLKGAVKDKLDKEADDIR